MRLHYVMYAYAITTKTISVFIIYTKCCGLKCKGAYMYIKVFCLWEYA